jgi:hypothetical protein
VTKLPVPSHEHIFSIVDCICKYPPEEINISGGDPLLLPHESHALMVGKLHDAGCKAVKIIVNPKSITRWNDSNECLEYYDWIGLSINTVEELELTKDRWDLINSKKNVTIITNFNIDNVFNYSMIESFVRENSLCWQIQFTMYSNDNVKAIYSNNDAKDFLFERIKHSKETNVKLILADNINSGECGAGIQSIGILSDGTVVPCLSMRSWSKVDDRYGNVLKTPLKEIWERNLTDLRCNSFKCCKDICNAPYEEKLSLPTSLNISNDNTVFVYGVSDRPWNRTMTVLYGVQTNQVMAYAVQTPNTSYWSAFKNRLEDYNGE